MKISVVYLGSFPPKDGKYTAADRRIEALTHGLNLENKEIDLIIPSKRFNSKEAQNFKKFPITPLGNFFKNNFLLNRFSFWIELVKRVNKLRPNALIFYSPSLDLILPLFFLKFTKVKLVLEACDLLSTYHSGLKKINYILSERLLPKFMDLVLSISSPIDEMILKTSPKVPLIRVPVLIEPSEFNLEDIDPGDFMEKYNVTKDDPILFYMGQISIDDGVDVLLKAFNQFLKKYPKTNAKFFITGWENNKRNNYVDVNKFIEENNLKDKLIYLGFVDDLTLKKVLKISKIVSLIQIDSTFNKAGLPTKSAEYAMTGKAIIASKVGDIPKYFTHLDNIYFISNNSEILNALETLLKNEDDILNILGNNAKKVAEEHFDYRLNGQKIYNEIKNIVK